MSEKTVHNEKESVQNGSFLYSIDNYYRICYNTCKSQTEVFYYDA